VIIISGDGDFFCLVEYLAQNNKLLYVLTPNKHYSKLFKPYSKFIVRLDQLKGELGHELISRDSRNAVPSLEFHFSFKPLNPRKEWIIVERDALGRIIHLKPPTI